MPTLHWIGKDKVINHHIDVPFRVLNHKYGFDGIQKEDEIKSGNKIIHGDNLEALKALLPQYEGKIKCVYIDPPYNTGNEGWRYNDNVNDPRIKKWLDDVVGKEGDDFSRHDKWLCMMYPRLKLLQKLLSDDGVIFISLDENEISFLRCIMNEIFGESNFVSQITLLCNPKGRSQDKYFSTNHEYILVYSKTKLERDSFSIEKTEELIEKEYKLKDESGRYRLLELRNTHREFNRTNRPNLFYPFFVDPKTGTVSVEEKTPSVKVEPLWPDGFEGCWTWGKDLAQKDNHLLIAQRSKDKWKIFRKSYAITDDGENAKRKLFTIWQDPKFYTEKGQITLGEIFPGFNKNDFPQPKSVDLIMEILRTYTKDGDTILDCNGGSGTTAHAVLNLNKQDGANRKFILIEMMDYANELTAERIKRVIKGYNESGPAKGSFDFYELGNTLFNEDNELNRLIETDKLREYIYYSETRQFLSTHSIRENEYFLNSFNGTNYYFFYDPDGTTTLNYAFLSKITSKADQYIIYADVCLLPEELMTKHHIVFKKITRDIIRF
jgi:adenine-specific DNA-methyltransferase